MAGWVTFWLPVGLVLIAALAMAAGWNLRKRLERQHKRAVEASAKEFVLAAGRARDRARNELEELESRYKMLRSEHRQLTREIEILNETCAQLQARLDGSERKSGHDTPPAALPRKQPDPVRRAAPVGVSKPVAQAKRPKQAEPYEPAKTVKRTKTKAGQSPPRISGDLASTHRHGPKRSSDIPAFVLRAPNGPKDDLKAIRGIGPGLEQALNALGVFHYCQLAGLTAAEIDWLGQRLGSFPGRIRKDRWPAQARRLFASSPAKSAKPAKLKRRGKAKQADEIGA